VSVALYSLAETSEWGGQSSFNCDKDVDVKELCQGYGAASAFYFFAFFTALAVAAVLWKWQEKRPFAVAGFFGFLALFALATMCIYAGNSNYYCGLDKTNVSELDDSNKAICNGFGFAAFCLAMSMAGAAVVAGMAIMKQDTGSLLWMGFIGWAVGYLLGLVSSYGAEANIYCSIIEKPTDSDDLQCNGYGGATTFDMFAVVAALVAAFFTFRGHEGFKQLSFLAMFALFYLGYVCFVGGQSAAGCKDAKDADDDGFNADFLNGRCNGDGAATFFGMLSFAVLAIAAVLTLTPHGAPQPDDAAPAGQVEKDVPSVNATPVAVATPVPNAPPPPPKRFNEEGADV
jgi:hypothetical protein